MITFELKHVCKQSELDMDFTYSTWHFETPISMPVGTKASVKTLSPKEIKEVSDGLILGNTYHLWLTPGLEVIKLHGELGIYEMIKRFLLIVGFQYFH